MGLSCCSLRSWGRKYGWRAAGLSRVPGQGEQTCPVPSSSRKQPGSGVQPVSKGVSRSWSCRFWFCECSRSVPGSAPRGVFAKEFSAPPCPCRDHCPKITREKSPEFKGVFCFPVDSFWVMQAPSPFRGANCQNAAKVFPWKYLVFTGKCFKGIRYPRCWIPPSGETALRPIANAFVTSAPSLNCIGKGNKVETKKKIK